MIKPSVDYRQFRFSKLNTPEFSHVWLLLYWPLFGLGFSYVERFYPVAHYIEMHCALDDLIPFNEWFLIPYMFWFVYLIGAVAYTFFFDVPGFRRMMRFVMITYSVTLIIYFLFPTCQMLRPEVFPRDNALTRFIAGFYVFDTNTNVCPSLHVIGSMAAFFAFWYAPIFSKRGWLWGDRIFEKCGIRRDEEGDGGKTLEIRGKRRLSARDGGANYQQS